jgi:peptidoglycan/xylan/chitin deacetylase (PgdA/CDA1 family)
MEDIGFEFSPITTRKPLKWPGGARVTFTVHLGVEHFEYDKPIPGGVGPDAGHVPDVRNYSVRDYGHRVGIWRVIDLIDKYNLKVDAGLNAMACDHHPVLIEEGKKRNWEFMAHGITNSWSLTGLKEEEERKVIKQSVQRVAEAIGKRPGGWIGPNLAESFNTRKILVEEGMRFIMGWCNDDQPYMMNLPNGKLVSVPYSVDTNDLPAFNYFHLTPVEFEQRMKDHFDVMYEEGAKSGGVMGITLHPFVIGIPSRIKCLDRIFQYVAGRKDVWYCTPSDIVNWCYEQHYFD